MTNKDDIVLIPAKVVDVLLKGARVQLPNGDVIFVDKYYEIKEKENELNVGDSRRKIYRNY